MVKFEIDFSGNTVYHSTLPSNLESIKKEGLKGAPYWLAQMQTVVFAFPPKEFETALEMLCGLKPITEQYRTLIGIRYFKGDSILLSISVDPDKVFVGDEGAADRIFPHPKRATDEQQQSAYKRSMKTLRQYINNPMWEGRPYDSPEVLIPYDVSPNEITVSGPIANLCPKTKQEEEPNHTLFKCSVEASWLKAFLRAYSSVESYESYWLWTSQHIEGKTMDPLHVRAIVFKISPPEYYATKDKVWVQAGPEDFLGALKRYKVQETVPLEVRDDGTFWVGELQVGNVVEEKDLPSGVIFPTPVVKADGFLKVAVRDFKRIVTSLSGVKLEDATVGFRLKGRDESTMILFRDEETFSRVDVKPYEKWLLDIGGSALSCYNLDLFNASLVPGLSDVASITIGDQAPCEISYKGDFFDVAFYMAHSDYRMETFKVLLEKKPVTRRLAFVLEKAEIDLFRDLVRSVNAAIRGEEVWIGVNVAYGLFLYWKFYDHGYFNLPKRVFREFWDVGNLAGSFRLSSLASWLRGVEEIECFLEGEPPTAMVLVGKGESIAPKEARSDEIGPLDVPAITPVEVFRGPREILVEVFADAVAANDDFLVFITSPYEIKVIGQDAVYYRASLPLDGFKTVVEEEYVPISSNLFRLGEFFKVFPGYVVSIGRPEVGFDVYVGGETATGEFRAMFAQTAEEAARAVDAYKAEMKPPTPPKPEEVKPLPPAIPRKEDVLEVLRVAPDETLTHEALVSALVEKGFNKSLSLDLVAEMIREGDLYEPKPPYIKISAPPVEVKPEEIKGYWGKSPRGLDAFWVEVYVNGKLRVRGHLEVRRQTVEDLAKAIQEKLRSDVEEAGLPVTRLLAERTRLAEELLETVPAGIIVEAPPPAPPKLSLEEFSKVYREKLLEWLTFSLDSAKPGLSGNLHYDTPEYEAETLTKFTRENLLEKYREEIEKDVETSYGSYKTFAEHDRQESFMVKWFPDRLHGFASKLVQRFSGQLLDEAKERKLYVDTGKIPEHAVLTPGDLAARHARMIKVEKPPVPTPPEIPPARLIEVHTMPDGTRQLVVRDGVTGAILMTGDMETLLQHHPDAIVTENARRFAEELKKPPVEKPEIVRLADEAIKELEAL